MARKKTLINLLKWCCGNWLPSHDLMTQYFHCLKIHTAFNTTNLLHFIIKSQTTYFQSIEEESITNVNTVTDYLNKYLLLGVRTDSLVSGSSGFPILLYATQQLTT